MEGLMRYILLALVILILSFGAAVMPALSIPTPSPQPTRAITIELLTEPEPEDLFEVVDVFDSRHREGFLIWTKQEYFWQPGDYFNAGSLTVDITLDGMPTHPFVFWSSSASTSGYDEDQNVIGSYLSAAMEIGVDTAALPLGEHTMTIHLETPHHQVFMQSWDFVIRERETPRIPIPTDLAATAQYLWQSPEPTPIYMHSHRTAAAHLDLCQRGVEGICVTLDDSF